MGSYTETLQTINGCDSVVTLNLTINNSAATGDTTATACDNFVWYGNTYTSTGSYTETLQTVNGCDSVVTLNLTINNSAIGDTTAIACDNFVWYGNTYTSTGSYTETLQTVNGCDSVVTLNLTIYSSPTADLGTDTLLCNGTTIDLDAGSGFTYLWNDATTNQILTASTTGEYIVTITDANGCSDSDTVNVTLADPLYVTLDSTNITCNGLTDGTATVTVNGGTPNYSYLWNDGQTTAIATNLSSGTYTVSITDDNNCGTTGSISIAEPTLLSATVQEPPQFADFTYIGEYQNLYIYYHNDPMTWLDAQAKANNLGGDLLVIHNAIEQAHYASILPSNSWIGLIQDVNDPNYSEPAGGWKWVDGTPATYTNWGSGEPNNAGGEEYGHFTGGNHVWNDHQITHTVPFTMQLDKSVANSLSTSCHGGNDGSTYVTAAGGTTPYNYVWDDANAQTTDTAYNLAAGDYVVTVTDANGCTAKDTATISEPDLITGVDTVTACESYTWVDGNTYIASNNTATHTVTAANGCDSVVTLNLTINNSASSDTTAMACENFVWYGNTYTSTGSYTETLQTINGCDSVVTLNLTINNSAIGDTTATACDSFVWYGNTYTSTGSYTETLQTINGCDSVVTLNLTINNSATGDTTATACDNFVWYGNTYISTGSYTETLQTINGCDSVVTLNLTINNSAIGDTTAIACDSFDWYGNTYTSTGSYTETLQTVNGCDSVVTLNLTVNSSPTVNLGIDTTLCSGTTIDLDAGSGFSYLWNDATTNQTLNC